MITVLYLKKFKDPYLNNFNYQSMGPVISSMQFT